MRGFSDEERKRIENQLVETARQLFTIHGFQKTTVEDITDPVGIAESTFYRFFDTKSEIFVAVLLREQDELIDAVETELQSQTAPEEQLERLFRTWASEFEERPLLLQSHQAPQEALRSIDHESVEGVKQNVLERISPLVEHIQSQSDGFVCDLSPGVIVELLSVVELVVAQKEAHDAYGWSGYATFKDTLIHILVQGLLGDRTAS